MKHSEYGARSRWYGVTYVVTALALVRVALVAVLPYERAVGLFDDDAYYYFGVARFIADGAGSTFNGLDNTNGYHPLWLGVLIPVFAVSSGQAALVWVAVLSGVLFIASGLLFDYVGRVVERPLIITVAATPVLVLAAAGPAFWFSGMETGLLLFLVLTVAAIFIRTDQLRAAWFGCNWALGLGVLMALVVLARLDAIFPMVLLGVLAAFNWRSRRRRELAQLILALVTPPALILTGYFTLNLLAFDTLMPVSGQAKALGGASRNFEVILQFVAAPILFGQPIWLGAIALVVVPVAVAIAPAERALSAAARFSLVILLGSVFTVAYYAVTSSWRLWPWYFYGAPVALALAAPTLFDRIPWGPRLWRLVAVATCGGTLMLVTVNAVRVGQGIETASRAFVERGPEVATRLDGLMPVDVPIAMGDRAGSFGYHLDRPMVHLEGLVNSRDYLEALRTGHVTDFLAERRVGLYARADADPGQPLHAAVDGYRLFTEPEQGDGPKMSIVVCDADLMLHVRLANGTSYRVWHYRPALNHSITDIGSAESAEE